MLSRRSNVISIMGLKTISKTNLSELVGMRQPGALVVFALCVCALFHANTGHADEQVELGATGKKNSELDDEANVGGAEDENNDNLDLVGFALGENQTLTFEQLKDWSKEGAPLPAPDKLREILGIKTFSHSELLARYHELFIADEINEALEEAHRRYDEREDEGAVPAVENAGDVRDADAVDDTVDWSDLGGEKLSPIEVGPLALVTPEERVVFRRLLQKAIKDAASQQEASVQALAQEQSAALAAAEREAEDARQKKEEALQEALLASTQAERELLNLRVDVESVSLELSESMKADAQRAQTMLKTLDSSEVQIAEMNGELVSLSARTRPRFFRKTVELQDDLQEHYRQDRRHEEVFASWKQQVDDLMDRAQPVLDHAEDFDSESVRQLVHENDKAMVRLEERMNDDLRSRIATWEEIDQSEWHMVESINALRTKSLAWLPPSERRRLWSLEPIAKENLKTELAYVAMRTQRYLRNRLVDVFQLPGRMLEWKMLASVSWALLKGLGLIWLALRLRRHAPEFITRLRGDILKNVRSLRLIKTLNGFWEVFEEIGALLVWALLLYVSYSIMEPVAPSPETLLFFGTVIWALAYNVAARITHISILKIAKRQRNLTVPTKLKIMRSVRLVQRYLFVSVYLLFMIQKLVGAGWIYRSARGALIFGALVMGFVLIKRWQVPIADAFLEGWPNHRLSKLIERNRNRWFGFVFVFGAFLFVAGKWLRDLLSTTVNNLEIVKTAYAYLTRTNLERQAKDSKVKVSPLADLPESLRDAFAERPAQNPAILVQRTKMMQGFIDEYAQIESSPNAESDDGAKQQNAAEAPLASVLFHGEYGIGRTTMMQQLKEGLRERGVRVSLWSPLQRISTESDLLRELVENFNKEEGADIGDVTKLVAVAKTLRQSGDAVYIIDGIERFFLRKPGGYVCLDALLRLMRMTHGTVRWVLSAPTVAFNHLNQARSFGSEVDQVVEIPKWSEEEIRDLIQRKQRFSKQTVSFRDFVMHQNVNQMAVSHAQVMDSQEAYIRMLWSFSGGNPRIAQFFWLRSLCVDEEGGLGITLYNTRQADELEVIPEANRFVLFALVLHRSLSISEAALVSGLKPGQVQSHIQRGVDLGLYRKVPNEPSRYQVTLDFWDATIRFLKRKNLMGA